MLILSFLITGSSGFVASNFIRYCTEKKLTLIFKRITRNIFNREKDVSYLFDGVVGIV
jgi:nucleoside-diphosphate-sugar epimerase